MSTSTPMKPGIASDWWQLCPNPDIPEIGEPRGEVVDHCIFRAADSTWQLWTQIRGTSVGRIFFRWQGCEDIERSDWDPKGICWEADQDCGESWDTGEEGWIHAPYVCRADGQYIMYYGGGPSADGTFQICAASSSDGVHFDRILNADGASGMFTGPCVARDPMVIRHGSDYIIYYAADEDGTGVIAARTSPDPVRAAWSDYRVVSRGGFCGTGRADQQCPFVISLEGYFYLFKMAGSHLFRTGVYRSEDPLDFGEEDECLVAILPASAAEIVQVNATTYVSSLVPGYNGVRLARIEWVAEESGSSCSSFRPEASR